MRRTWALRAGAAASVVISVVAAPPVWAASERLTVSPDHGTARASFTARFEIDDPDVCDRYSAVFLWDDTPVNEVPGTPMQLVSGRCYAQELITAPAGASEGRHMVGVEVWDILVNGHRARITVPFTIDPDPIFPAAIAAEPLIDAGARSSSSPPQDQTTTVDRPARATSKRAAPDVPAPAAPHTSAPPASTPAARPQGMGVALLLLGMLVGSGIFGGFGRGLVARLRPTSDETSRLG